MINQVLKIVRESSELLKSREFEIDSKGSASNSVTSTDKAVEKKLKMDLECLIEGCGFIGEESIHSDYNLEYLWVIDPIDGTKNFIRNLGCSGISVGLIQNGEPILGVVYNPYKDEMFYAEKGKGSYLNGKRIYVSDNNLENSLFCTAMSLYNKDLAKHCFNIIEEVYNKCDDIRRFGSAVLELTSLACGRTDLYFEIRIFPWDFAASQLIIEEAGGFVGSINLDRPVFNRPIPYICANTKENFDYLMKIVEKELPEIPYID